MTLLSKMRIIVGMFLLAATIFTTTQLVAENVTKQVLAQELKPFIEG
ncbi:MAG: hypothetical protein WC141_09430 [Arcobacteraceae bacterium]